MLYWSQTRLCDFLNAKKDLHYSRNDCTYGCQHRNMAFCQTWKIPQVGIQKEADKDWSIYVYPIEVGARGFINNRVHGNFLQIGIDRKSATSTIHKMSHMTRRCSYVVWLYRFNQDFKLYRLNGTSVADEAKKSNLIQHFSLSENDSKQEFKSWEVQYPCHTWAVLGKRH